jgi:hypothetical protein
METQAYRKMIDDHNGLVVSVVAGGYSVRDVDLDAIPGFIIGVNDSAYYLPRCDAIVSMDRLWSENREDFIRSAKRLTYLRRGAAPPALEYEPYVTFYKNNNKTVSFGPTVQHMNGTSSATVALNLAYTMWPKRLFLFGFDMCRGPNNEAHWHPDYPWNVKSTKSGKLAEWAKEFSSIYNEFHRKKVEVFNVSTRSKIGVWKRYSPEELGMAQKVMA